MGGSSPRGVVFVTGAAGDIGGETARTLAARGWSLALTDHPSAEARLAAVCESCETLGATVWTGAFDVTDETGAAASVRACVEAVGPPRGLFNNAGYQGQFTALDRYPLEDARRVFEVNILGVMTVLAVVSRAMIDAGSGGAVVNMASMAGVSGAPNMPAYSASKAAVIGLTRSAAKDLAPAGIRVNAVSPAFIGPGAMWDNQVARQAAAGSQYYATEPAAVAEQMIGLVPLRRFGSTAEVAQVVAFLLSDDASYVNGVNIEISGGSV
jgi:NAD(P)-dependent dehydrogenase (short-subunit alcohol dehydrogenase family)